MIPGLRTAEGGAALSVEWIESRSAFRALAPAWEALAERAGCGGPFFRPEWFAIWAAALTPGALSGSRGMSAPSSAALRLLVTHRRGALSAALPLRAEQARLGGVPVRMLRSLSDDHSQRFDVLAEDPAALAALWQALAVEPGWDVLELRDVPAGGHGERLLALAAAEGFPVGRWPSLRSPHLPLPADPEALEKALDAKFRSNLRRRAKRLAEEVGPLRLERITDRGAALDSALEEGWRLEASGWKGRAGSAIGADPTLSARYRAVARALARRGELSLHFLVAGERRVAFHFAVESGGVYYLLKPGYEESLARFGPGHLLLLEVARALVGRGAREIDFLGDDMEWKRCWTETARQHAFLYVLQPGLRGRALAAWKFEAMPRLRRLAERARSELAKRTKPTKKEPE